MYKFEKPCNLFAQNVVLKGEGYFSKKGKLMEDNDIVELFLARNEDAISKAAEKYGSRIRQIAYGILNDYESAEECENDTYHKAWDSIPPNEPRKHLFAYLGRIVRNIALNRLKADTRKKRSANCVELTKEMMESIPSGVNLEADVLYEELQQHIESYLDTCSEIQQKIFVRRYWYWDSVSQISRYYGLSQGNVKTMLSRMRKELKRYLSRGGYEI